jgi:hypothetical protein
MASGTHSHAFMLFLTSFFVMIYTSSRRLDGQMATKMLNRPAQPKMKFFLYDDVMQGLFSILFSFLFL